MSGIQNGLVLKVKYKLDLENVWPQGLHFSSQRQVLARLEYLPGVLGIDSTLNPLNTC